MSDKQHDQPVKQDQPVQEPKQPDVSELPVAGVASEKKSADPPDAMFTTILRQRARR